MNHSLDQYRADHNLWPELDFCPGRSDDDRKIDLRSADRETVTNLLYASLLPSDYALVRHLFEQDIMAEEGFCESGFLKTAYLLAHFRNPADIPLFHRARKSNFDAGCSLDIKYLYLALGAKTDDYMAKHHPDIVWEKFPRHEAEEWRESYQSSFAFPDPDFDALWESVKAEDQQKSEEFYASLESWWQYQKRYFDASSVD
jgi:hypothetical protein